MHSVRIIPVGSSEIPGPELFWMSRWDEWLPLRFQSVLIQGPNTTVLVNTGPAADLSAMNAGWSAFLGERAAMRREPGEFILDQLERVGVAPDSVTHVILTPLQLYTVSNVLAFANAQVCIAKRGWVHFHTTHAHPHDSRETSLPEEILVPLITSEWNRVRLLEDEDEVAPGIRTWWSGGHHRASLGVDVDTERGVVTISDSFFYLDNVSANHPIGIAENIYECLAAHERAKSASIVIPLYDPKNFDRFPDGVVS